MPRVSREQTDRNRIAIENASARLFREQGIKGVSVSDLMAAAGLTHGGFYGHFESKNGLAAVACTTAFGQSAERWKTRISGKPTREAALKALIDGYLSPQSRNSVGTGCPMAALATDVAREPMEAPIHAAYIAGLKSQLNILLSLQDTGDAEIDRSQALAQLSMLVGAMVLSRASRGDAISDEILTAASQHLAATTVPQDVPQ